MNEFNSSFWGLYVAVPTLLGILGLIWLLLANGKRRTEAGPVGDTGHVWDDTLRDLDNPLPRWWVNLFLLTSIFGVVYLFMYPGLVITSGGLGYTSAKEHDADQAAIAEKAKRVFDKYASMDIKQIAADPQAHAIGEKAFLNYCAPCHGSDAGGGYGFPNLNKHDWQWGGEPEQIKQTILEGRTAVMTAFGGQLSAEEISNVANYVRQIAGLKTDEAKASKGKAVFEANCVACHQQDGTGNTQIGAPNLTHPSKVWLYGSSEEAIIEGVTKGRNNHMPSHKNIVSPELVPILTAYVWGLSNK